MESNEWGNVEEELNQTERLKREQESLRREQALQTGQHHERRLDLLDRQQQSDHALPEPEYQSQRNELETQKATLENNFQEFDIFELELDQLLNTPPGDNATNNSETEASLDEKIDALSASLIERLGREPKKRTGLVSHEFPLDRHATEAWRLAALREQSFRTGMREYLKYEQTITRGEELVGDELRRLRLAEIDTHINLTHRRETVEHYRDKIAKLRQKQEELVQSNPEVFIGAHLHELRQEHQDLETGRLVETPYVKGQKLEVLSAIRTGTPLFIHGHLGSGKSELAMAATHEFLSKRSDAEKQTAAETAYLEWLATHPTASEVEKKENWEAFWRESQEAFIISGSKQTHQSEFFGHRSLNVHQPDIQNGLYKLAQAEEAYKEWLEANPEASEEIKTLRRDGLRQLYLERAEGTFSSFFLGPIYRAMREGRPIIIDEVDAIPHDVLISLNHILTRKVGDVVAVQQDSGEKIVIKEGFSVIMTGNFPSEMENDLYIGRQPLDAAFLSRLAKLRHDYLPQSLVTNLSDASNQDRSGSELFHTLLARTMDRYGNLSVPGQPSEQTSVKDPDVQDSQQPSQSETETQKRELGLYSVNQLWKLAVFARQTQNIFSGQWTDRQTSTGGLTREALGKEVLSLRHLTRIIDAWKADNQRYQLDHYIFEEFVNQAGHDTERTALYTIAQNIGLFDTTDGWPIAQDVVTGAGVARFTIQSPQKYAGEQQWLAPRDTVECAFGSPPERKQWPPEEEAITPTTNALEVERQLTEFEKTIEQQLQEIEAKITQFCPI